MQGRRLLGPLKEEGRGVFRHWCKIFYSRLEHRDEEQLSQLITRTRTTCEHELFMPEKEKNMIITRSRQSRGGKEPAANCCNLV